MFYLFNCIEEPSNSILFISINGTLRNKGVLSNLFVFSFKSIYSHFSDIITFWQVCNSEYICLFSKLMCYDLWYLFEFDLSSNCHVFTHANLLQYNHARFAPFCTSHQKEFSKCGNSIYLFIYFILFIPYLKKVTLLVKDYSTKRPSISHTKYIQYDNTKRDIVQT